MFSLSSNRVFNLILDLRSQSWNQLLESLDSSISALGISEPFSNINNFQKTLPPELNNLSWEAVTKSLRVCLTIESNVQIVREAVIEEGDVALELALLVKNNAGNLVSSTLRDGITINTSSHITSL